MRIKAGPRDVRRQHARTFAMYFSISLVLLSIVLTAHALALPTPNVASSKFAATHGDLNNTNTTVSGVQRIVVRYATAARWKAPVVATSLHTLSSLPPVCPQLTDSDGNFTGDEDCLYVVLYVPSNPTNLIAWVHGGSLLVGGANDPMLEGSKLAQATGSVVAVVQYRLGALGFLPPTAGANGNLGVRDVIAALKFLKNAPQLGFSVPSSAVTVAGQSSGATLVRALLASPSASSLFSKAVLHSDTANYAFYKPATLTTFQNSFFPNSLNCSTSNTACLNALPLSKIMSAQQDFTTNCVSLDAASAGPVPLRPVVDGSLITSSLTETFPSSLKPILVTNVKDEGAPSIFGALPELPASLYSTVLSSVIPDARANEVLDSSFYQLNSDADTLRETLSKVVTDLGFRCPDWTLARAWAARGGSVYTALFLLGATHPSNDGLAFCTGGGVCHQDEIGIVFGTARAPDAAQTRLIGEVQTRYAAFLRTSNPNAQAAAYAAAGVTGAQPQSWVPTANANTITVLPLGGDGPVDMGACVNSFWGSSAVPYDYQLHGL